MLLIQDVCWQLFCVVQYNVAFGAMLHLEQNKQLSNLVTLANNLL